MVNAIRILFQALTTLVLLSQVTANFQKPPPVANSATFTSKTIGECHACKLFIASFEKGLERTARGKYEGGDAAWEEENLKRSYRRSEMRLLDIQEGVCTEETDYSVQCHNMAEKAEEFIEEWWELDPDEYDTLHSYICIEKLKVCCPEHHYGTKCAPCPGDHKNLCSGNGKCRGEGTRKGNGTCLCNPGYTGDNCDQCSLDYYQTQIDGKTVCSPCNKACLDSCRGDTIKDCIACKPGYKLDSAEGCLDVNECETSICKHDEYCLNSIGSYLCAKCDKACQGCHGDGPDMCRKCAKRYSKKGGFCVPDAREMDADAEMNDKLTNTRYFTYIGLIVATGIVVPSSSTWGAVIGALVFSYILGSEYYCMVNGHRGILVNLKDYDLMQMIRT